MKFTPLIKDRSVIALALFTAALLVSGSTIYAINTVTEGYRITTTSQTITAHGICRTAVKTSGNDVFAPTRTSAEWNAFIANKPGNVTLNACAPPSVCSDWTHSQANSDYTEWYVFKPIGGNPGCFRIWWHQDRMTSVPVAVCVQPYTATTYVVGGYRYERGALAWNVTDYAGYYIRRCTI
jgi:hypothetical protein